MDRKIASLFSLAQRAGKLVTGEFGCEKALQNKTACLIIVCEDASDNTKKKFSQKCFFYKKPFYIRFNKDELSAAIGKQNRVSFAVIEPGFADRIIELIEKERISEVAVCPE